MPVLRSRTATPVPEAARLAFSRDLTSIAARSLCLVLVLSVGGQLVQELGGSAVHVAALRSSMSLGLLLSLLYVALGRARSPLSLVFAPEAAAAALLAAIAFVAPSQPAAATVFTVLVAGGAAMLALATPLHSTVYGLVYAPEHRARLVASGRMLNGLVAIVAAWGFGRLFTHEPESYRIVYPIVGVIGVAMSWRFVTMPVKAARDAPERRGPSAWTVIRKDRSFRRFQLFQFVLGLGNLAVMPLIDVYARQELHLSIDLAVLVVPQGVVMQLVMLTTVRQQAKLFDRIGVVRHRVLTSTLIGCAMLIWAFADNLGTAILAAALWGLGMSGGQLIWIIGSLSFAQRDELGTYSSIHTFLTGLRGIFAPTLGALVLGQLDNDYRTVFLGAAVLVFLSALGHRFLVDFPHDPALAAGGDATDERSDPKAVTTATP